MAVQKWMNQIHQPKRKCPAETIQNDCNRHGSRGSLNPRIPSHHPRQHPSPLALDSRFASQNLVDTRHLDGQTSSGTTKRIKERRKSGGNDLGQSLPSRSCSSTAWLRDTSEAFTPTFQTDHDTLTHRSESKGITHNSTCFPCKKRELVIGGRSTFFSSTSQLTRQSKLSSNFHRARETRVLNISSCLSLTRFPIRRRPCVLSGRYNLACCRLRRSKGWVLFILSSRRQW